MPLIPPTRPTTAWSSATPAPTTTWEPCDDGHRRDAHTPWYPCEVPMGLAVLVDISGDYPMYEWQSSGVPAGSLYERSYGMELVIGDVNGDVRVIFAGDDLYFDEP